MNNVEIYQIVKKTTRDNDRHKIQAEKFQGRVFSEVTKRCMHSDWAHQAKSYEKAMKYRRLAFSKESVACFSEVATAPQKS